MFDIVEKHWPMSEGDGKATRKKRPRILAITTDCCTGCAGSPACIEYCPIEACMFWIPDDDHPPFGRIEEASRMKSAKGNSVRSILTNALRVRFAKVTNEAGIINVI